MGILGLVVGTATLLHVVATVVAILAGMAVSPWLGVVLLPLLNFLAFVGFNWTKARLASRVRELDDEVTFRLCSTGLAGIQRQMMTRLPSNPRCRFCQAPFEGLGRFIGIRPSRKNPNYCESCFDVLPTASKELEVGILFADIRGFTPFAETHSPAETAALLTRFYEVASRVLVPDDAFVQLIGDEVMAFYITEMPSLGDRTAAIVLSGAQRLVAAVRSSEDLLPIGVGLGFGLAEVGTFKKGPSRDFTVVGDLVNTTARLQATAGPSEIVMSEPFHRVVADRLPAAEQAVLDLKGKADPTVAYVVRAAD